jgi:hypothetical protein
MIHERERFSAFDMLFSIFLEIPFINVAYFPELCQDPTLIGVGIISTSRLSSETVLVCR